MFKRCEDYKGWKAPKHIIRVALISSPLLALFSIAPMTAVVYTFNKRFVETIDVDFQMVALAVVSITVSILIFWAINIYLFYYFRLVLERKSWSTNWLYVMSYLEVWTWIFILRALFTDISQEEIHSISFFPFIGATANNTLILLLLNLFEARNKQSELQLEKAQLEFSNLRAQHEQLKSHIEPHFLFNALNTLKILQKKSPELAQDYTVNLSNLLRRSISFQKNDLSSLQEEISFLKDYLELQKIRFRDSLDYKLINLSGELDNYKLPIFTLQILAENAIKHNAMSTDEPLILEVTLIDENTLEFRNEIRDKARVYQSPGMGLKNLSERCELLNVNPPEIDSNNGTFRVLINLI